MENSEHMKIYYADYYQVNYEKIRKQQKRGYDDKVAAGYRYRKDPVTGKHKWVFVGLPEQEVAA